MRKWSCGWLLAVVVGVGGGCYPINKLFDKDVQEVRSAPPREVPAAAFTPVGPPCPPSSEGA